MSQHTDENTVRWERRQLKMKLAIMYVTEGMKLRGLIRTCNNMKTLAVDFCIS